MMQFRCFACGLVFSNGMPPLEAMSTVQAEFLGSEVVDRSVLDGTPFEDLSPYNFCGFCITVIRDFPSAISHPDHELLQEHRKVWCSCGFEYMKSEKDENGWWDSVPPEGVEYKNRWIWTNRMKFLHVAKLIYKEGDFSLLYELLFEEV